MTQIEVFADIVCPFAHVGLRRLVEARARAGRTEPMRVRAWPLEWVNGEPLVVARVEHHVEALRASVAPELFAGFDPATFPTTSIPALALAADAYAVSDARGEAVSLALRDALFEQGLDIADPAVLGEIARQHATPMSDSTDAVRGDWDIGRARGVLGSPHFFVGGHDWFCPSLDIRSSEGHIAVRYGDGMREFYAAAFG